MAWIGQATGLLKHRLLQNMLALWGAQFVRKVIPVITMPYLGRVLGPSGLGLVAFVQGFTMLLSVLVDFGFNLSATREIAQARDDQAKRAELIGGVLGAQILLASVGTLVTMAAAYWVPALWAHPQVLLWGLAFAVAEASQPYWYFQGMERLRLVAALDIGAKALAAVGIIALVTAPNDAWMVLAIQAAASFGSATIALTMCIRESGVVTPNWTLVQRTLKQGWPMFLFRSSDSIYALGNSFVLGLFAPATLVGYYAGSEKISKAFFGLLNPIREALYPRLSKLAKDAPGEADRLARTAAWVTIVGGIVLGSTVFALAPTLIHIFLGPKFQAAIPVLQILALLPPLMAVTHSVGFQYLLPHGRNDVINRIMVSAGIVNFALAALSAPRWGHIGMAVSVVAAEAFLAGRMVWAVRGLKNAEGRLRALSVRQTEA